MMEVIEKRMFGHTDSGYKGVSEESVFRQFVDRACALVSSVDGVSPLDRL